MILSIKRILTPPRMVFRFPIYLRTGSDRYFVKIKSATQLAWLQYVDAEKCNVTEHGSLTCGPEEFLDVEFMVKFFNPITEKDYLGRLRTIISDYEHIKQSLNL